MEGCFEPDHKRTLRPARRVYISLPLRRSADLPERHCLTAAAGRKIFRTAADRASQGRPCADCARRAGGYLLSAPPDQISVGQVLVALEGDMLLVDCLRDNICGNTEHCAARKVWKRLSDSILSALNSITLQDMINDSLTPTGPCPNDSR